MGRVEFRAGEVLSAGKLNDWRDGLGESPAEPSLSPSASLGDSIEVFDDAIRRERRRRPFLARLTSASSPYSWVSRDETACGTFADGARSGTSSAYETNATSGLNGKIARLYPDRHGAYRFQWTGETTSPPCSGQICVTVSACQGESDPRVYFPPPLEGATVTVKQGATTIGTATTDIYGNACVGITASGSYTVEIAKTGYLTKTLTVSSAVCGLNSVTTTLKRSTFCVTVLGLCGEPVQGAAVDIVQGGGGTFSCTSDANGRCCATISVEGDGSAWDVTVSHSRFVSTNVSWGAHLCEVTQNLNEAASGYQHLLCNIPVPDSLTFDYPGGSATIGAFDNIDNVFCLTKSVTGFPSSSVNPCADSDLATVTAAFRWVVGTNPAIHGCDGEIAIEVSWLGCAPSYPSNTLDYASDSSCSGDNLVRTAPGVTPFSTHFESATLTLVSCDPFYAEGTISCRYFTGTISLSE